MASPLIRVAPALQLLSSELQLLPASGGAIEYLQRPDLEELEDALVHAGQEQITAFLEIPEPSPSELYRPTPPTARTKAHFFRYFVDGSLRTYFLATGVAGSNSFPIELAQIGAAVVERADDGRVRVRASSRKILLLVPKVGGRGVPTTLWDQRNRSGGQDSPRHSLNPGV